MKIIPTLIEVVNFLKVNEVGCFVGDKQSTSLILEWTCADKDTELKLNRSGIITLESQDRHLYRVYSSVEDFGKHWKQDVSKTLERV